MKEFLDQKYAHFKDKVKIIPHFFDINEMPEELNKSPNKKMILFMVVQFIKVLLNGMKNFQMLYLLFMVM